VEKELSKTRKEFESEIWQLSKELAKARQVLIDEIEIHERVVNDLKQTNTELRKSQERTDLMLRSIQMAGGSLELNQVLERIAAMLAVATGMPHCGIYLMDEEKNILIRRTGTKSLSSLQLTLLEHLQFDPDQFPLIQEAMVSRKPIICQDARSDPRVTLEILHQMNIRSLLVVPICLSDRVLGMALNYTIGEMYPITKEIGRAHV
jgi:hypothetical protein